MNEVKIWTVRGEYIEKKGSEKYRKSFSTNILFPRRNVDVMRSILKRKLLAPHLKQELPDFYRFRTLYIEDCQPASTEQSEQFNEIMSKDIDSMSMTDILIYSLVRDLPLRVELISNVFDARTSLRSALTDIHSRESNDNGSLNPHTPESDELRSSYDSHKKPQNVSSTYNASQENKKPQNVSSTYNASQKPQNASQKPDTQDVVEKPKSKNQKTKNQKNPSDLDLQELD